MGETNFHHHQPAPTAASSRLGLRSTGGEIVEVQGGHIVRSTGRKDRHSKVCTAKGPRDRRVRLSAHTAIQFYDVQDRLGYDRPSKAVDWLIKKAKAAIDELAELPAWKPTNTTAAAAAAAATAAANFDLQEPQENRHQQVAENDEQHHQNHFHQQLQMGENDNSNHNNSGSFLPPSMDSDSIADTIKSFFPMGANSTANPNSSSGAMQFQSFPPPDLLSRTSSQSQDLRLSLQSFQDPIHFHHHNQNNHQNEQPNHHNLFSGNTNLGFDWPENGGGFQRMVGFGGSGGEMFSGSMQTPPFLQPLFGHQAAQFFTTQQRGPLQSSNTPPVRGWIDPMSAFSAAGLDHQQHQQTLAFHHPQQHGGSGAISGFASSGGGGFSGFRIPARIQGDEEEHDGISDKPSSASSDSHH